MHILHVEHDASPDYDAWKQHSTATRSAVSSRACVDTGFRVPSTTPTTS
jgi:hypothetical protein